MLKVLVDNVFFLAHECDLFRYSGLLVTRCISESFSDPLGPNDFESLEVFHFYIWSHLLKVQLYAFVNLTCICMWNRATKDLLIYWWQPFFFERYGYEYYHCIKKRVWYRKFSSIQGCGLADNKMGELEDTLRDFFPHLFKP